MRKRLVRYRGQPSACGRCRVCKVYRQLKLNPMWLLCLVANPVKPPKVRIRRIAR